MIPLTGLVEAVSLSPRHGFSKVPHDSIRLIAGEGIEGDAHRGRTTQHLFRMRQDAAQPNLCQVHLLARELLDEFAGQGFALGPGDMGENVLTCGLDLLALPLHTTIRLGPEAVIQVTGLRTPCSQIDGFRSGLQKHCWGPRDAAGKRTRRVGIMSVVLHGGWVHAGDPIALELPAKPCQVLPAV